LASWLSPANFSRAAGAKKSIVLPKECFFSGNAYFLSALFLEDIVCLMGTW
jgi:hypothetical protein